MMKKHIIVEVGYIKKDNKNMGEIKKKLQEIFSRCKIAIDNNVISEEYLMKVFVDYFDRSIGKDKHNVGFVLHTGSVCFDVVAVVYATLLCLLSNKTSSHDIIENLECGDYVVYGQKAKERYVYDGIVDGADIGAMAEKKYAKLSQKKGSRFVPEKLWHYIEPYYGNSKRLDGRGLKKKNTIKDNFFKEVLKYEEENIPGVIDTSTVFITSREKADYLIKNIEIMWENRKACLLELVTASYFTDEDEFYYSGNTGKNEAVLKFTSRVSVARSLILKRQGNIHKGFMILGQESISKGISEIPELLNRKSLQYAYVCAGMETEYIHELLEECTEAEVFVCSENFLMENSRSPVIENYYTDDLYRQVNTIIDKELSVEVMEKTPISLIQYKRFREILLSIKRSDVQKTEKDYFIIQAHSLMNLFATAVFSMTEFKNMIDNNKIEINSVDIKMQEMQKSIESLPTFLKEKCEECMLILNNTYAHLMKTTTKEEWLKIFLLEHSKEKMAVIVPKAYYAKILQAFLLQSSIENTDVVTTGRFDAAKVYDHIIVVGDIYGKRFNAFRCNSSTDIISLLYPFENETYNYRSKKHKRKWNKILSKSTISFDFENDNVDLDNSEGIYLNDVEEVENYILQVDNLFDWNFNGYGVSSGGSNGVAEVVKLVIFEDGQKAMFTKNYKAYVFDEYTGVAKEIGVHDLCEGDSIVFTSNDNNTKDIVKSVMQKLMEEGKLSKEISEKYNKSRIWKEELIKFMQKNDLSVGEVVMKLHENGATVQDLTIKNWLDEESHTVGPRKQISIQQIGKTIGNKDMIMHSELYFEACREIRSLRMKILDQMGQAMINKLNKMPLPQNSLLKGIYNQIDDMAIILRVERVSEINRVVPVNITNRPISM